MNTPSHVTLGDQQLKIQRWQRHDGWIAFSTVIRGDALVADVIGLANDITMDLEVGDEAYEGICTIVDHHRRGSGPTALHRIEIRFDIVSEAQSQLPGTVDSMLRLILEELRLLRAEVAELRGDSPKLPVNRPLSTTTLLDFDIPLDED